MKPCAAIDNVKNVTTNTSSHPAYEAAIKKMAGTNDAAKEINQSLVINYLLGIVLLLLSGFLFLSSNLKPQKSFELSFYRHNQFYTSNH